MEPGILFQLFRWHHLYLAFEEGGAILSNEDTVAEESDTVVFAERVSQDTFMLTICLCFPGPVQGRIQGGAQGARAPPLISRVVIFQLNNFLEN